MRIKERIIATELERLIAEQALDMEKGHRISRPWQEVVSTNSWFDPGQRPERGRDHRPKVKAALDPDDVRHGTFNAYCNLACRCPRCTQANTLWHQAYRQRRRDRNAVHGQSK